MALSQYQQGDPSASGDFAKRIEYNAKAGRVYRVDRVETAAGFENVKTEIPMPFGVAFDFEGVDVGWAHFAPGTAPNLQFVKLSDVMADKTAYPAQPSPQHSEGFRVRIWNSEALGDEPREFSSTARSVRAQLDTLHTQWTVDKDAHPGKVPWVVFTGVNAETNKHGTNYAPILQITEWVDAAVFPAVAATPATAPAPAAPAPAPTQTPGPAPAAVAPTPPTPPVVAAPPAAAPVPPAPSAAPMPPSHPAASNPAAPEFGPPAGA